MLYLEDSHFSDPICVSKTSEEKGIKHEYPFDSKYASLIRSAVDDLQGQFERGEVKALSLRSSATTGNLRDCPVWCRTKNAAYKSERTVNETIVFYTSHYIGNCTIKNIEIKINPRFGDKLFNRLLQYACNIYLPKGNVNHAEGNNNNAYWLVGLLWKAVLERALTSGQIPKEYQTETKNLKTYKGHLNIQKHIKANLVDQSRFFCTYRKLTMDNTINQTIRYAHSILREKNLGNVLSSIASYDNKLESFGVSCPEINPSQIDRIKYTKMNLVYRPVMEFSKAIISRHLAETKCNSLKQAEAAFFIDMAELWEMYLLRILQNNLGDGYNAYSPNLSAGGFLLENNYRSIRPDIIIEKDNRIVMILDAKYKRYKTLGRTAQDPFSVSREDLYQMTTYLYHYAKGDEPICGVFVSPASYNVNEKPLCLEYNPRHRIGLVNMEIDDVDDDLNVLQQKEQEFVGKIGKILEALET